MADNTEEITQAVANAEAEASKKNPFVALMLILNVFVMGIVAYLQYSAYQRELNRPDIRDIVVATMDDVKDPNAGKAAIKKDGGELITLEPFTANLSQGDGPRRFLQLSAVLKLSKSSKKEEFTARKPQIRDTIISILNSKRPEDLLKVEGKDYLKEEIKAAINSFLVDSKVADVFYVGFQIN